MKIDTICDGKIYLVYMDKQECWFTSNEFLMRRMAVENAKILLVYRTNETGNSDYFMTQFTDAADEGMKFMGYLLYFAKNINLLVELSLGSIFDDRDFYINKEIDMGTLMRKSEEYQETDGNESLASFKETLMYFKKIQVSMNKKIEKITKKAQEILNTESDVTEPFMMLLQFDKEGWQCAAAIETYLDISKDKKMLFIEDDCNDGWEYILGLEKKVFGETPSNSPQYQQYKDDFKKICLCGMAIATLKLANEREELYIEDLDDLLELLKNI